ncbi:hypothetical protein GCM10022267_12110 [Lentzea roselyniae]|uniref:Uncharacterized protein n=1 Tax=Lentzea roselyniae TaxID=531940 RepID=A0ABP7A9C9_9PSEU
MDPLDVRLLGPLEVTGPGGVLRLAGTRQRSLLALPALRAHSVLPATHLIDALRGTEPHDGPVSVRATPGCDASVRTPNTDKGKQP